MCGLLKKEHAKLVLDILREKAQHYSDFYYGPHNTFSVFTVFSLPQDNELKNNALTFLADLKEDERKNGNDLESISFKKKVEPKHNIPKPKYSLTRGLAQTFRGTNINTLPPPHPMPLSKQPVYRRPFQTNPQQLLYPPPP